MLAPILPIPIIPICIVESFVGPAAAAGENNVMEDKGFQKSRKADCGIAGQRPQ
jgi:hypothetical protein